MSTQSFWDKVLEDAEAGAKLRRIHKASTKNRNDIPAWECWQDELFKWYPFHIKEKPSAKDLHILNSISEKVTRETNKTGESFIRWAIRNWESLGYKQPMPRVKEFILAYKAKLGLYIEGKYIERETDKPIETQGKISRVIRPTR